MSTNRLETHEATRYLVPLREGGSLPAVVDTENAGLFVTKFRGAGQGAKALIAEVIVGTLAREIGLATPEMALINLAPDFARTEPDPEIQDILEGSRGLNFGLRYLDGALNFDPVAAGHLVTGEWATRLVWLDAFVTNLDRTAKNPNLLVWNEALWLIDHGAALYAHHDWPRTDDTRARSPFAPIRSHVLLDRVGSGDLEAFDRDVGVRIDEGALNRALALIPDSWLIDDVGGSEFADAEDARSRYLDYLRVRLETPRAFVEEAVEARDRRLASPPTPLSARR